MCMFAIQSATGAEPPAKQSLYVLQHKTLGLWQTAQHEEEAKHSQASVQKKCTYKGGEKVLLIHYTPI